MSIAAVEELEDDATRVSGSAIGPAAENIRKIAKEIGVSSRDLVEAMLENCDPAPAIKVALDRKLAKQKAKIESLKAKYS